MVDVMRPRPETRICDPACGTGGFLLAAHDYIVKNHPSLTVTKRSTCKLGSLCTAWRSSTASPGCAP
jgi:type I restriction enzyme M protein